LMALGVDGVMLGRALYDGLFTLEEALSVAREASEVVSSSARLDDAAGLQDESLAAMIPDGPTALTALDMPVSKEAPDAPEAASPPDGDEANETFDMAETRKMAFIESPSPDQSERDIAEPRDGGVAAGEDADRG
jgi:hypothetical protein